MGVLAAERIKLTSTKSPWWCSAVIVVVGIGFAALFGLTSRTTEGAQANGQPLTLSQVMAGVTGIGVMVLMILAALTVTSEYRFGIIRTTFQAVPDRARVLLGKTALVGGYGAVLITVVALASIPVGKLLAGSEGGAGVVLEGNWRSIYGLPIYSFLFVVIAIGVGVLVRQSAAAISLLVLWSLVVEPLLSVFGSFGKNVAPFLPFANASHFLQVGNDSSANWHWGPWGSLIYFTAFAAIIFGAALVTINQRDA